MVPTLELQAALCGTRTNDPLRRQLVAQKNICLDDVRASFLRTNQNASIPAALESANAATSIPCFICRLLGHIAKNCPHADAINNLVTQRAGNSPSSHGGKQKFKFKGGPAKASPATSTPTSSMPTSSTPSASAEVASTGLSNLYVVVDDCTRTVYAKPLRLKSEAIGAFKTFKAAAENESGKKIREVMTDNARELCMGEMRDLCVQEGIKLHTSVPYHPASNGVAERAIGVLTNAVRAMLRDSGLPGSLWAEAFITAAYVHNRTPTKVLKGLTPFEARYGMEPDLAHLRAFGAPCSIVEPLEKLQKLDDRARMCCFVGYKYGGGGYRVWDPKGKVVVESRDVVFFEDGLPPPTLADVKATEPEPTTSDDEPLTIPLTTSVPTQNTPPPLAPPVVQAPSHNSTQPRDKDVALIPDYPERSTRSGLVAFSAGLPGGIQLSSLPDPRSVREAMAAPDADGWKDAMDREMENLRTHDVYEMVPRVPGMRTLRLRWVLHRKFKNGIFEKNKARLVARGNHQLPGVDYGESFSPVMRLESLRTLLSLAAIRDLDIVQFDITSAYLHGTLKEELFLEQPDGYKVIASESVRVTDAWLVDSGATSSMSSHRSIFLGLKPDRRAIRLANGSVIYSEGLGSIRVSPRSLVS